MTNRTTQALSEALRVELPSYPGHQNSVKVYNVVVKPQQNSRWWMPVEPSGRRGWNPRMDAPTSVVGHELAIETRHDIFRWTYDASPSATSDSESAALVPSPRVKAPFVRRGRARVVVDTAQPLPPASQPPAAASDARRLPFWGSSCLDSTVSSMMKLSHYNQELEGQQWQLPPLARTTESNSWKFVGRSPGFGQQKAHKLSENKWLREPFLPRVQMQTAQLDQTFSRSDVKAPPLHFHSDHARDAAAVDPLSARVRKVAKEVCALCVDNHELDTMYCGVYEYVSSDKPVLHSCLKVARLGKELLRCITSRRRRALPDGSLDPLQPSGSGILSWMPRHVKRPYFLEIVQEQIAKRKVEIQQAEANANPPGRTFKKRQTDKESLLKIVATRSSESNSNSNDISPKSISSGPKDMEGDSRAIVTSATPVLKSPVNMQREEQQRGHLKEPFSPNHKQSIDAEITVLANLSERQNNVFQKLSDDGRVHRDDLATCLQLLGFVDIQESWISDCVSTITKYSLFRDTEFLDFVNKFTERQSQAHLDAFREYDADGSGAVDITELGMLMAKFGIEPMEHVLHEVVQEVDADDSGMLEFREFEVVLNILRMREGFTSREYDDFLQIFHRVCAGANTMATSELPALLKWLGFLTHSDDLKKILAEVDVDGSGNIDKSEFIACMRHVRDREVQLLKDAMSSNDSDTDCMIDRSQIMELFIYLGYMPEEEAIEDAIADAGFPPDFTSLDLSMMWRLLSTYRKREGLTRQDVLEIDQALDRHGKDGTAEIVVEDVGKVLRALGHPLTFDLQRSLAATVDVNHSGTLDAAEVRKLVRMTRADDMQQVKQEFERILKDGQNSIGAIPARASLLSLGCVKSDGAPATIRKNDLLKGKLNLNTFCQAAMRSRREARERFRRNGGFTLEDLEALKGCFDYYDKDGSGDIGREELIFLLEEIMPKYAHDPENRPTLVKLIDEVDANGDGSLDFSDFMRLVQCCYDFEAKVKLTKENKAVDETGFTDDEIQGFREIFVREANGAQDVSLAGMKSIMNGICPMGAKHSDQFCVIFAQVMGNPNEHVQDSLRKDVDFPNFLRMMRKVIDTDFADVQERFGFGSSKVKGSKKRVQVMV